MTTAVNDADARKTERAARMAAAAAEGQVNAKFYEAERAAILLRTAKLRRERLEREAIGVLSTPAKKAPAKRRAPAKSPRKTTASAARS
jgi:UDP-N-acetylglucosamine:LPS N-acetylglucosamine transferase